MKIFTYALSILIIALIALPAISCACTGTVPITSATGSTAQVGNPDFHAIDGNLKLVGQPRAKECF